MSRGEASAALESGRVLGRYQLLDVVASGGMGCIWAARQLGAHAFQKLVAVKVSLASLAEQPEYRAMFLDEARLASAVHHPNVCSVHDLGEDGASLYLVMEWVDGPTLSQLLNVLPGRRLGLREAAWVVAEASAGLHAAHELRDELGALRELVHRDVSPQNILLTSAGHVKVADFGIARARDQLHERTRTGELKGKLSYLAPEQITSRTYDRRVDVYALGCVLYTATVGRKPFAGGDTSVIYEIAEGRFARPSEIIDDYPPALEEIILRAMGPVDSRFATADALRLALEGWLGGQAPCNEQQVALVLGEYLGGPLAQRAESLRAVATSLDAADVNARDGGMESGTQPLTGLAADREAPHENPTELEAETKSILTVTNHATSSLTVLGSRQRASRRRIIAAAGVFLITAVALAIPFVGGPAKSVAVSAPAQVPPPETVAVATAVPDAVDPAPEALAQRAPPRAGTMAIDGGDARQSRELRADLVPRSTPVRRGGLGPKSATTIEPAPAQQAPTAPSALRTSKPIDTTDPFAREQ
jgi:eukaryotic-like serine/threonine-protein kinase